MEKKLVEEIARAQAAEVRIAMDVEFWQGLEQQVLRVQAMMNEESLARETEETSKKLMAKAAQWAEIIEKLGEEVKMEEAHIVALDEKLIAKESEMG